MLRVAFVIPTFHRTKSVIRQVESFLNAANSGDVDYRFHYLVQDASPSELTQLGELRIKSEFIFSYQHVDKYPEVVIGNIRADAISSAVKMFNEEDWTPDIIYMIDDDVWFSGDISALDNALIMFNESKYDIAFIRGFKNRKYRICDIYDSKSNNNTAPATDLGIIIRTAPNYEWLFDNTFRQLTVGEDCYLMLKAMAMGWYAGQITGINHVLEWDENWLMDTSSNGGGLHEAATELLGACPKDMCTRNKLMSEAKRSFVQWHCADLFHYEAANASFRRIRPDLYKYLDEYCYATKAGILRKEGAGIMPYDGTNRVVFGLDKPYDFLEDLNTEWLSFINDQNLEY